MPVLHSICFGSLIDLGMVDKIPHNLSDIGF